MDNKTLSKLLMEEINSKPFEQLTVELEQAQPTGLGELLIGGVMDFEVIKNYGFEGEEVVFVSNDHDKCVDVSNKVYNDLKQRGEVCTIGVYPSDAMVAAFPFDYEGTDK